MAEIAILDCPRPPDVSQALRVLVTCSNRKSLPVPDALRLSSLHQSTLNARARAWASRLSSYDAPTRPARTLYAGDHWHVAQSVTAEAEGAPELWVASAGYGLIHECRGIKPYGATFSDGPDSAARGVPPSGRVGALQEWWTLLADSVRLADNPPRSICSLVASAPEAVLVVALSRAYLLALGNDLIAARGELRGRGTLILVSAGTKSFPGLDESLVDVGADVQTALGGSRLSLNARIVRYLVRVRQEHGWQPDLVASSLGRIKEHRPRSRERKALTDREVVEFISRSLQEGLGKSKTASLRRLREQGFACEQGRFNRLFAKVAGQ